MVDPLLKKRCIFAKLNRGVEQLVARRAHNPKVVGSSPAAATKTKGNHSWFPFLFYTFCFSMIFI